jgi:PilZ domain
MLNDDREQNGHLASKTQTISLAYMAALNSSRMLQRKILGDYALEAGNRQRQYRPILPASGVIYSAFPNYLRVWCRRLGLRLSPEGHAMGIGDRMEERKPLSYPGKIFLWGDQSVDCTLLDVSKGGANLAVPEVRAIPDTFLLMLSQAGGVRRKCKVVRRSMGEIGVQFV